MAMSQSERIRRIQEESNRYLARAKTRDSSELTLINQARASKTKIPQTVQGSHIEDGCCTTFTAKGNGTNMEYLSLLQASQGCAICSDPDVSILSPRITLPTPCFDRRVPPFSQQDLSGTPYTPACTPGFQTFFPPKVNRGPNCNLPHLPYDS